MARHVICHSWATRSQSLIRCLHFFLFSGFSLRLLYFCLSFFFCKALSAPIVICPAESKKWDSIDPSRTRPAVILFLIFFCFLPGPGWQIGFCGHCTQQTLLTDLKLHIRSLERELGYTLLSLHCFTSLVCLSWTLLWFVHCSGIEFPQVSPRSATACKAQCSAPGR